MMYSALHCKILEKELVGAGGVVCFRSPVFDVCGMMVNRAVVRWWLSKESRDATIISTD